MPESTVERAAPLDVAALESYAARLDVAECALLAQQFAGLGAFREVVALCSLHPARAQAPGLRLCEARARFALGERDAAFALIEEVLAAAPDDPLAGFYYAQFCAQAGRIDSAKQMLRRVVERAPDFPGALAALAQLCLPGPPYRDVLRYLHQRLRPRVYLELGVEHGHSLQLAASSDVVIGVDPGPAPGARPLPRGTRFFQQTSDTFFAAHTRADVLGSARVDLAFIDGMHWFDAALRDFHNVERWCHAGSLVVLHDCLPIAPVAAARERRTHFWVGDTWRAVEYLYQHRPELKLAVVPCPPSGLVLVTGLDPEYAGELALEPLLASSALGALPPCPEEWPERHALVENSERGLDAWLAQRQAGQAASSA